MNNETYNYNFKFLLFTIVFGHFVVAQELKELQITIQDSLQQPVPFTTVVLENGSAPQFKQTDELGKTSFKDIKLSKPVIIKGFQIGYYDYAKTIDTWPENNSLVIVMRQKKEQLATINILYDRPVKQSTDTLVYKLSQYTSGDENKLREALKKLPGIEVDRDGNVTSNGRNIERLFIENRQFFTGDEKIGVNNIPAHAVEKVEILDNYSDVGFLKDLQNSNELIMNLKLKEEYKQLLFGDIKAGAGIKNRFAINPSNFLVSEKKDINLIGDFNNTGVHSFSQQDYNKLNSGVTNMTIGDYTALGDELSEFLNRKDFNSITNRFGAGNLRKNWEKNALNTFVVINNSNLATRNEQNLRYNLADDFNQLNQTTQNEDLINLVLKSQWDYKPNNKTDFRIAVSLRGGKQSNNKSILTTSPFLNSQSTIFRELNQSNFHTESQLSKEWNSKLTTVTVARILFNQEEIEQQWNFDRPANNQSIPFITDVNYTLDTAHDNNNESLYTFTKFYYKIKEDFQINLVALINRRSQSRNQFAQQLVSDGSRQEFNNPLSFEENYDLTNANISLETRFKTNNWTIEPVVILESTTQDYQNKIQSEKKQYLNLFTRLTTRYVSKKAGDFNLSFRNTLQPPSLQLLSQGLTVNNQNSVYTGDPTLHARKAYFTDLRYEKANYFKGNVFTAGVSYNNFSHTFAQELIIEEDDVLIRFAQINKPETNLSWNLRPMKYLGDFKIAANYDNSKNTSWINNEGINLETINKSNTWSAITGFYPKKGPQIDLSYSYTDQDFILPSNKTKFYTHSVNAEIVYDFLKHFRLQADYSWRNTQSPQNNEKTIVNLGNLKMQYLNRDKKWNYSIQLQNVFNQKFIQSISNNDVRTIDNRTFIMPRMLLFYVTYTL